jgi:hypothetical protein
MTVDEEFKVMGGNSGIYYANRPLTDDEKYGDDIFLIFYASHIDGDSLPVANDLILNIPDGGFYRVLEVADEEIATERIAISGGGGGGGGGGSTGPGSDMGSLDILYITPQTTAVIAGEEYNIEFTIVAKDSAGDPVINTGVATWTINGQKIIDTVKDGYNKFRVDQYLDPTKDNNSISLVVSMDTGGSENSIKSKKWNISAVALKLKWDYNYNEDNYISGDTFTLNFTPSGGVDCTVYIDFYDRFGIKVHEYSKPIKATGSVIYTDPIKSLGYGAFRAEMYLIAVVNNRTYSTYKDRIKHELSFKDGGSSTILTVPFYQTTATQYDTLNIPFMVYDPDLDTCEVKFYVNDSE